MQRLRKNKPGMRAGRKVEPVDRATVDATLPLLSQPVAGLVELMWWTGARPSELFFLRPCDIDRSGSVWTAGLVEHKTANKGMRRTLLFGAQSQAVLQSFLLRPESSPLFSPRDAVDEMQRKKRGNRKTPLYPSHAARYRRQRVERPDRIVGEVYTADAFRKAVQRAVTAANRERKAKGLDPIQSWSPYQLRHAAATRIRKDHGIEAARVLLGHSSATMTEVYAEADMLAAAKVVEAAG